MRLVHRTNYWGSEIESSHRDGDVPFAAIWAQAIRRGTKNPCCHGFGNRNVFITNQDLELECAGEWSLWLVRDERGSRNDIHYFYKFALVPKGTYGYGRRGCESMGWTFRGTIYASSALDDMEDVFENYWEDGSGDFVHVHVGIMMDTLRA